MPRLQQNSMPSVKVNSLQSSSGGDWQEEIYQKIKVMKDMYLPELFEMYSKIASKIQQHDSFPHQPKLHQLEKLKMFKTMLERLIAVLQIPKHSIQPSLKDKLVLYEKQIVNFINTNRPRKHVPSMQQGQLQPPHMHPMQQSQPQITQVQSFGSQLNSQLQPMNLQSSAQQQNNMPSLQQNSMSSLSGVSTVQPNMSNLLQPKVNSLQSNSGGDCQEEIYQKSPTINLGVEPSADDLQVCEQMITELSITTPPTIDVQTID